MNRKNILIILGLLAFIVIIGGISYSYFIYNKDLGDVSITTGEISINYSSDNGNMTLTGIVPKSDNEGKISSDYIDFTVDGVVDTDKIYYELSIIEDSGNTLDTQYIKLYLTDQEDHVIKGVTEYDDLPSNEKETGKRFYRDTIDPNQNGTKLTYSKDFRLRIWLDERYNEPSTKTFEFDVNLFAKNVDNDFEIRTLYGIMKKSAVMDNVSSTYVRSSTGIDFGAIASDTNGKGVYMRAGTENDAYPILYYRGAVDNNNVIFGNFCWKAVRTTDTGGVKLIYNGLSSEVYEEVPLAEASYTKNTTNTDSRWSFDSSDSTWNIEITDNSQPAIEFTVPQGDNYTMVMTGTSGPSCGGTYTFYKNGTSVQNYQNGGGAAMNLTYAYGTLTATDVIKMDYTGSSSSTCAITFKLKMLGQGEKIADNLCNNTGTDTHISLDVGGTPTNMFAFNTSNNSPAYAGYMYGDVYAYSTSNWTSGARFGSSFTWDGTNYTLVGDSLTSPDATHHYSCNVTTESGTCTDLRYVYYVDGSAKYYITLIGGDGIEEALAKMQTNTNDSNAKAKIDTWYASNLTTYTNKLEDTIWCNDRSIGDGNNNGWIANGGDLETFLYYGAYQRSNFASNTSTVKNQPSLACANKNDSFTVSNENGNGKLTYPVALLTEDEMVLAGGLAGSSSTFYSSTVYLNNGSYYWSLSPSYFAYSADVEFGVFYGDVHMDMVSGASGLRPSVSLKPEIEFEVGGDGTATNPYIVKYE